MGALTLTPTERRALAKLGKAGGTARARNCSAEQLHAIAMKGVAARRKKAKEARRATAAQSAPGAAA